MTITSFWPLSANTWTERERAAAHAVIDSTQVTMGSKVREFEEAFAAKVGAKYAVMTNSGSSANLIMVAALHLIITAGRSPKDRLNHEYEAIVPAIAWPTTYAPLTQHGYKLILVDVSPTTLNATTSRVADAITPRTRIVMGVSILGNPAPLSGLSDLCKRQDLYFLEDNCESLGAKIYNQFCGTFGLMGTFSFFFSHHINTIEGGMLVTNDEDLYHRALCLRAHGWTRDLPEHSALRSNRPTSNFPTPYDFILPAYNVRPTEIAAAVGLVQLDRLDEMNAVRVANAELFRVAFAYAPKFSTQEELSYTLSVPFGFTLLCKSSSVRDKYSLKMAQAGIEHRLVTGGSFARHPAAARYDWIAPPGGTPNADQVHDCGFFVGNHPFDLSNQINKLREILS